MRFKNKGSYVTGIIGMIIGGLIATIPWVLVYVYGNIALPILSVLIAVGEYYGYTIFKGRPTKKLPFIIVVMSILIVILTSFIIIPVFSIMKEGFTISISLIKSLYASKSFISNTLKDAGIALVFAILGALLMYAYKKKEISEWANNTDEIKKNKFNIIPIIIGILMIVILITVIILTQMGILNKQQVSNDNISFEVNGKWVEYQNLDANLWTYYRYINTKKPTIDEEIKEDDFTKMPAYFNVSYGIVDSEKISTIEDVQKSIKESAYALEQKPSEYEDSIAKSKAGYDVLKVRMIFKEEYNQIEYLYYILKGDELTTLDASSYNMDDESELEKTVESVVESLKWLK